MKMPYLVVLGDGFPRKELLEAIDKDVRFGTWFYSMPNSFILFSSIEANAIDSFIKEKIGDKYSYFVTEISSNNRQGWMPHAHWDLLYRQGAKKCFELDFQGYYTDAGKLPGEAGVFCVYQCVYSPEDNSVRINELLHIDASENVRETALSETVQVMARSDCSDNQTLCYSFAPVPMTDLEWCVGALREISEFRHKNGLGLTYNFDDAYVITNGRNSLLPARRLAEKHVNERG